MHPHPPTTRCQHERVNPNPVNAADPTGAVTDVEAESWYHYYNCNAGTAGDRAQAQARTEEVRAGSTARRARARGNKAAAAAAAARAAAARDRAALLARQAALAERAKQAGASAGGGAAWYTLSTPEDSEVMLDSLAASLEITAALFAVGGIAASATVAGAPIGVGAIVVACVLKGASVALDFYSGYCTASSYISGEATLADVGLEAASVVVDGGSSAKLVVDLVLVGAN